MPLFLTSKVRLHCDINTLAEEGGVNLLFLTSKVRLHCDHVCQDADQVCGIFS